MLKVDVRVGIKVGIVGGTGYTGVELLRLLAQHPCVQLVAITSRSEEGTAVASLFPSLRGRVDLKFVAPKDAHLQQCDIVFFATPHGVAMQEARTLLEAGVRVIDLSADFRLKDPVEWQAWYGLKHASPELIEQAVYGLPEIHRDQIRTARLIANPGCYATAIQLGLLPLVGKEAENNVDLVDLDHLIADAKSGVSGAGRKAEIPTLFAEAADNFKAYSVSGHRHLPEIKQQLSALANRSIGLTFVPHLVPMIRGICATIYAPIRHACDFQLLYQQHYAHEPFVDVQPPGSHPDTRSVRASNLCRIAIHRPQGSDTLVVLSVIDNLVKGAAGQAVQNMNIMLGLDECAGLSDLPIFP